MKTNELRVKELEDKEYIAKMIGKYKKDFPQIKEIKLEEIVGGPLDFALLKKVSVFDYENNLISELFAKIYDPKRKVINFSKHCVEDNKRFEYSAKQQKFWNYIGIPSPQLYDFIDKEDYKILLMGFWSGPSHDLDASVIKDSIDKRNRDIEEGMILDEKTLNKIKEEKEILSKTLEGITKSMLYTINKISVIGIKEIDKYKNNIDKEFWVYEASSKEEYLKRVGRYIKNIILRQAIFKGDVKAEIVRKNIKAERVREYIWKWLTTPSLPKAVKEKVTNAEIRFRELFEPLIEDVIKNENLVYSQGDGHPYHLKHRNFEEEGKIVLRSGIYDSCRSRLEPKHLPKTKALLSYLFDYDYDTVKKLFLESLIEEENLRANINNEDIEIKTIENLKEDYVKNAMKCFDVWSLVEGICSIGREATDKLINEAVHHELVNRFELYENPFLPELGGITGKNVSVSLSRHDTEYAIGRLTQRTDERLERMIDRKTIYTLEYNEIRLIEGIKKICDETIFKSNGISLINGQNFHQQELKTGTE